MAVIMIRMTLFVIYILTTTLIGFTVGQDATPISTAVYPQPNVTSVNYTEGGTDLQGYLAVPSEGTGPYPAVIIIPDWDGVNFYEQARATMLSVELGWIGFAADIYGASLQNVTDMDQRVELATLYRSNSTLFISRIQAAIDTVKGLDQVDSSKIALIGYCFGGTGVLYYALEGTDDDITAIVSIHGGLNPTILNTTITDVTIDPKVLVLSGGQDDASGDIMTLETTLTNASAYWEITRQSGIQHAWTVWMGDNYNEWADTRTWESTNQFVQETFDEIVYKSLQPSAPDVTAVPYNDTYNNEPSELIGWVAIPDNNTWQYPVPGVLILPDWDGVNEYERERATLLAESGYIAFAADIFGAQLQNVSNITERIELITKYNSNQSLYVERINSAFTAFINTYGSSILDTDSIAIIGYCFGGTGVVQYLFSGGSDASVAVAYHGGLQQLPNITQNVSAFVLIESGGIDAAHGNQTVLEQALNDAGAQWEISRYSDVVHGFTVWSNPDAYSVVADIRSWTAMNKIFQRKLIVPKLINGTDNNPTTPVSTPVSAPVSVPTPVSAPTPVSVPTAVSAPTPVSAQVSAPTPSSAASSILRRDAILSFMGNPTITNIFVFTSVLIMIIV